MSSSQLENALLARQDRDAATRSVIVTGDIKQAAFWRRKLGSPLRPENIGERHDAGRSEPVVLVERGYKGNFLGTLQAYAQVFASRGTPDPGLDRLEQIVMLVGAGTRLSPFTQALGNMKSAFPLPDADSSPDGLSVGEAAIRSTSPWIRCLRDGGFEGLVIRWGDEVLIPSSPFAASPGKYSDVDAVRFGWRTDPTPALANQKEWLLVDRHSGVVVKDIPRQPIESLMRELSADPQRQVETFVNLGSLAASHRLLRAACDFFQNELGDGVSAANWDPYFWMALQCPDRDAWEALGQAELRLGRTGFTNLTASFPTFFGSVQGLKARLQDELGRELRVLVMDFGEPYWLDAGNHLGLRSAFVDIFAPNDKGRAVRTFLGLPHSIANGASFIKDSRIAPGARVHESIVIGSDVSDPGSSLDGAIVIGGRFGRLNVGRGGAAFCSASDDLQVDAPHGIAFRVQGPDKVAGHESVSTVQIGDQSITLRYSDTLGTIAGETYDEAVLGNPVSFREASSAASSVDPLALDEHWQRKLGRGTPTTTT
jgi:hypothetical protein